MSNNFFADVSDFLDFMPEVVFFNPYVSTGTNGIITYGAAGASIPCRIEMKNHLIVDKQGNTVVAAGRVFLGTTVMPDIRSKINLPAKYVRTNPPILSVVPVDDDIGTHHITIEIG